MTKFLQDDKGNLSSKRLYGSIYLALGAVLGIVAFGVALFRVVPDHAMIRDVLIAFTGTGLILLGFLGVAEKFTPFFKFGSKKND